MRRILIGVCNEPDVDTPAIITPAYAAERRRYFRDLHDRCGTDFIVQRLLQFDAHRGDGVFDWTRTDCDMEAAIEADMRVVLIPCYPGPWMTEDVPSYLPYTKGSMEWNDERTKAATGRQYHWRGDCAVIHPHDPTNHDLPDHRATRPSHIDPAMQEQFGHALGEHYRKYGDRVLYGCVNEPGGAEFWPPSGLVGLAWRMRRAVLPLLDPILRASVEHLDGDELVAAVRGASIDRLIREAYVPFMRGLKRAHPQAKTLGIEADRGDVYSDFYAQGGSAYAFDVTTFHAYDGDQPQATRIANEFLPTARRIMGLHPNMHCLITEAQTPTTANEAVDLIRLAANIDGISGVSFYQLRGDMYDAVRTIKAEMTGPEPMPIEEPSPDQVELERLRKMERDHATFDGIVSAAGSEFSNFTDLADAISIVSNVGRLGVSAEGQAGAFLLHMRNIKAALAAKRRSARTP